MVAISESIVRKTLLVKAVRPVSVGAIASGAMREIGWVIGTLVLGFPALVLLFPGGSTLIQVVAAAGYLFLVGLLIELLNPAKWMLSGLAAWGGVLLAGLSLIGSPISLPFTSLLVAGAVGPALVGGYLGCYFKGQYVLRTSRLCVQDK